MNGRRTPAVDHARVGLLALDRWLAPYRQLWNDRLDALAHHLEHRTNEEHS